MPINVKKTRVRVPYVQPMTPTEIVYYSLGKYQVAYFIKHHYHHHMVWFTYFNIRREGKETTLIVPILFYVIDF